MKKTKPRFHKQPDYNLRISIMTLILLLFLTVGFFIFAINMATYGAI